MGRTTRRAPGDLARRLCGADARQVGRGTKHTLQRVDLLGCDARIGIQQQHVATGYQPIGEREVHPRREPAVASWVEVAHAELVAQGSDLGQRRVVHDGDRHRRDRRERLAQQPDGAISDDDDLNGRKPGLVRFGRRHRSIEVEVLAGDSVPRALGRTREASRTQFLTLRAGRSDKRLCERPRVPLGDDDAGTSDDIGQRTGVARDDRDPAGHRLDSDSSELLGPVLRRERRDRQDVDRPVERRNVGRRQRTYQLDPLRDAPFGGDSRDLVGERTRAGDPRPRPRR